MSFPPQYEVTERTRLRVRYEIRLHGSDFTAVGIYWLRGMRAVEECQEAYVKARDESGLNARQFGRGDIFDEAGQHLAYISFDGQLRSLVALHSDHQVLKGEDA